MSADAGIAESGIAGEAEGLSGARDESLGDSLGESPLHEGEIELIIIRHGQTPGNAQRRYVGIQDQPLSEEGRRQAMEARCYPEVRRVYVSRLKRTHETAAIMFPKAEQLVVDDIQEMDFGLFSGRSADEMEDDPAYRAWVESNCSLPCPEGESRADFEDRVCAGMERFLRAAHERGEQTCYLVAHGGTMMASLSRFADDGRAYYEWLRGNCQGWRIGVRLAADAGQNGLEFRILEAI